MESNPIQNSSFDQSDVKDIDFTSLILDIIGDTPPPLDQDAMEINTLSQITRAAKRFFKGATSLTKAFFVSAATGQPTSPTDLSPAAIKLRKEMKDLMDQLRWLEAGDGVAETLAIAAKLKILQRAAAYCRLEGESQERSERLKQLISMHNYYLKRFTLLQGKQMAR